MTSPQNITRCYRDQRDLIKDIINILDNLIRPGVISLC